MNIRTNIAIYALLIALTALGKAKSDQIRFRPKVEQSDFWKSDGKGKYAHVNGQLKTAPEDGVYGLYHRLFKLRYKERFLLSATLLVFVTDGWHLMQTLQFLAMRLAMVLPLFLLLQVYVDRTKAMKYALLIFAGVWVVQAFVFHMVYTYGIL